jgi:hypothetical protein
MKIDKPGFYYDIPSQAYFGDPCVTPSLTQSIAKVLLDRSPAHARLEHPRLCPPASDDDEPEKYVKAQAIGNAAHALLIGRGKELAVGEFDNWTTKDSKKFKIEATAAGKTVILAKHLECADEMVGAALNQLEGMPEHRTAFRSGAGSGEVVLAWQEDSLWFRTMVDWYRDMRPSCYDLKTSGMSCAPHAVEDRASLMGWDLQGAMHERGMDAIDPQNAGRRKYYFVALENEPPYGLTVVELSEHDLTMGRKKLQMAVDIWRRCMATNTWPVYPPETVLSRPRGYTETKFLEREIAYDERRKREPMLTDLAGG